MAFLIRRCDVLALLKVFVDCNYCHLVIFRVLKFHPCYCTSPCLHSSVMIVRSEVATLFQYFVNDIYYAHERCSAYMSPRLIMIDPRVIYVCTPFLLLMRHKLSSRV